MTLLLGLLFLSPTLARAEATKELYVGGGFPYPNTVFNVWHGNITSLSIDDPAPPEGLYCIKSDASSASGAYSQWGIQSVTAINTGTGDNYADYANPNGSLRFWMKLLPNGIGTSAVQVGMQIGSVNMTIPILPTTQWQEYVIPLSSFDSNPTDFQNVKTLMYLTVYYPNVVLINHVRWTKPLQTVVTFPATTPAAVGNHREFVAEGRSANGEFVDVYPTWSVSVPGNSVSPATASRYTILTMGAPGGFVTATADGIGGGAAVMPVVSPAAPFGIVSETVPGLNLDNDSKLLWSNGGAGTVSTVSDTVDFVEGLSSVRAQISLTNTNDYAGWVVQWGLGGSPDSVTQDMSAYYDGSLRFWFKGPPALQSYMVVGMRSGNVPAGAEASKVSLSSYVAFDNAWHPVVIPLSAFAKGPPFADLSRMKVLFDIFGVYNGVGTAPGAQTFWVDNVRWDPLLPGPLTSITVTPASPVQIPLGGIQQFSAQGFDAVGTTVDIWPTWSMSTPPLGTLSATQGPTVTLTASASAVTGTLTASTNSLTATTAVNVGVISYTGTYYVYSDSGTGGFIGVSVSTAVAGSTMTLTELTGGSADGTTHYMQAPWTMVNSPGLTDAFAVWYVSEPIGSRFMSPFASGFLQFYVRTNTDLQVSLRSANIKAGNELCKFSLHNDLGVALDNQWHLVTKSLADFKLKDPNLDFSQIANYFTIGAVANKITALNGTFDIADVLWQTGNTTVVDPARVYAGLVSKQNSGTGLVLTFDNDAALQAYTYDQALAAMNYTYYGDTALAKKVFDAYQSLFVGGWSGFADVYNRDSKAVIAPSRSVGPNAWLLLALIQYRSVTGQTTYDTMIDGLAAWLKGLQDPTDGGVQFGFNAANALLTQKSTEHNLDCYAAFKAYNAMTGNAAYQTAANAVSNWLAVKAWNPGLGRFNVGLLPGGAPDTDKALDIYSWAPLATSSYTAVLAVAKTDFENPQTSDMTGQTVDGFDFGGVVGNAATYKDAVWLEGTAQMASAYWFVKDSLNANYFINQLEKAVATVPGSVQGLAYATNPGTGYGGFIMSSHHPAASSDAWYLFAKNHFNPFRAYVVVNTPVKNISDNGPASSINWTGAVAASTWVRADQYIQLDLNSVRAAWGVQIYTDNTASDANPMFTNPVTSGQPGSNPAGMVGVCNSSTAISLAWNVQPDTTTSPAAGDPNSYTIWSYVQDKTTPDIPLQNTTHFSNGAPSVIVAANQGLQLSQGSFVQVPNSPNAIYLEANFGTALGGCSYKTTTLRVEYFYP